MIKKIRKKSSTFWKHGKHRGYIKPEERKKKDNTEWKNSVKEVFRKK